MSFIVKSDPQRFSLDGKISLLNQQNVPDKRVTLDQIKLLQDQKYVLTAPISGLIWFHVLQGSLKSAEKTFDYSTMTMITSGFSLDLVAMNECELLIGTIQDASIYEKDFKAQTKPITSFDWSPDREGLCCMSTLDQTMRSVVTYDVPMTDAVDFTNS